MSTFPTRVFRITTIIIFIAAVSAIGAVPFGGRSYPRPASASSVAAPVTISIWDFPRIPHPSNPNDRYLWLSEICDRFCRENPGVTVNFTKLTWSQGAEKIKIATFAGVPPDIASSDMPVKYIKDGLIEPVDDCLDASDRSDYFKPALESFSYGGKIYGFPWAQKTDFLYLNKEIFKKAGVPLPEGGMWSYGQFVSSMKKIAASRGIFPFWFNVAPEQASELPFIYRSGGNLLTPGTATDGTRFLYDAVHTEKISPPGAGGMDARDVWVGFREKGDVACAPFGIWALPPLIKEKKVDFDIAQYPSDDPARKAGLSGSSVIGFFVFRQSVPEKRDACIRLARYITNAENQRILKYYGQFPTRKSVASIYDDSPVMKKALSLFEHSIPLPVHPAMPAIDEKIKTTIQKILLTKGLSGEKLRAMIEAAENEAAGLAAESDASAAKGARSASARRWYENGYLFSFLIAMATVALLVRNFYGSSFARFVSDLSENRFAYFFVAPAVIVFAVFFAAPVARGIMISFQDFGFGTGIFEDYCGFKNFAKAFSDSVFLKSIVNTLFYTLVIVPANILTALVLAVLIYRLSERSQTAFKGAFYLPGVVSIVTLCIIWRYIFDAQKGLLNSLLGLFSMQPVAWLTSEEMSLFSIIIFTVLKGPGGALLIYLTALCNIPKDYFEAAAVDGAGPFKTFFSITLPLLRPQTMFLAITLTIDAMQVFAPVMLLTGGGPANSSEVVVHRIYKEAFNNLDIGQASAMSVLLFAAILLVSVVQYRYFRYDYY